MMYLYNTYLLYIYMRNIYGIYVTIRFLKYFLGYTYDFFNYMYSFIKKEENIKMLENKKS
jgi:hypothetical protein